MAFADARPPTPPSPCGLGLHTNSPKKRRLFVRQIYIYVLTSRANGAIMGEIKATEPNKKREVYMYTKDKSNRITLRLNEEQFSFVKENADILGVSPSDFLRMVINSTMAMSRSVEKKIEQLTIKEGNGRENDKADSNNIL